MNDLRERLDRRAEGFTPDRAAYERVLDRVALRRVRRRITAGVTAFAVSAAAFTGLWAATHGSDSVPVATPTPTTVADAEGLHVGLAVHLPRGLGAILATHFVDVYGVYAVTPNSLFGLDPASGYAKRTTDPGWDPEVVSLADHGEGTIVAAWNSRIAWFGDGIEGPGLTLATPVIDAVMDGESGLWVSELKGGLWVLARIDPRSGSRIGAAIPIGQGHHSIVEADGYVFVGGPLGGDGPSMVRVDPGNGFVEEVTASTTGGLAVVGTHLWGVDGDIWCVDAFSLESCGDVEVPRAAAIAGDGDRIWVLSTTGSTNSSAYIPDPGQPATLTLLDGRSGAVIAGPIPLPDVTPANISAANGHGWIAFYDSGLLLRVDTCPDPGCTSNPVHERVIRIEQRIAALDASLHDKLAQLDELRAVMRTSPMRSVHRQIRVTREQIVQIEERRAALMQHLLQVAPG